MQYDSPENIVGDSKDQHALPMVAIYLLGHKVGDIEEPVLYVRHHSYDYNGQLVTKGLPNPFVDSLTHDSIIVQIPRLHGKINNRLDEVLSIFDQTRKTELSQKMLDIDDNFYPEDDQEMQRILRRLLMAATNAKMRMEMNVEDEYYSIIESRDTDIMMKDREIAEKNVELAEKSAQLNEKSAQLNEKNAQLNEKNAMLEKKSAQLEEAKAQLRTSILLLHKAGMSTKDIAASLKLEEKTVKHELEKGDK